MKTNHEEMILEYKKARAGERVIVVYYESIKREPKMRGINKCRCDFLKPLEIFLFSSNRSETQ
jgi:hypothetical protein